MSRLMMGCQLLTLGKVGLPVIFFIFIVAKGVCCVATAMTKLPKTKARSVGVSNFTIEYVSHL